MRRVVVGFVVAALVIAGRAEAQSSVRDVQLAQSLFEEGRRLMDAGQHPAACTKFAESQRLDPGLGTLLNLAICREKEGRFASAQVLFDEALRLARRDNQPTREAIAEEHLRALSTRQGRLLVRVAEAVPGIRVRVDGVELREPAWGVATNIDPGPHRVEADAPNRDPFVQNIQVFEGVVSTATVQLPVRVAVAPPPRVRREKSAAFVPLMIASGLGFSTALVSGYIWGHQEIMAGVQSQRLSATGADARMVTIVGLAIGAPLMVIALTLPKNEVVVTTGLGEVNLRTTF